jgi:hypothetical protein
MPQFLARNMTSQLSKESIHKTDPIKTVKIFCIFRQWKADEVSPVLVEVDVLVDVRLNRGLRDS